MVKIRIVPQTPALVIEGKKKSLVITDLHIGFESELGRKKIIVGKNTTISQTTNEVNKIIKLENPDLLILLGDIKSNVQNITNSEWNDVPYFFKNINQDLETILVPGNHDGNIEKLIPKNITVTSPNGIIIDDILLTHGHAMPKSNFSNISKIIMGHIHPVFFDDDSLLNGERVWITMKLLKEKIFPGSNGIVEITIIPSFNKFFYSKQKKFYRKSISPIIHKIDDVISARVLTLDGTIIGDESTVFNLI